MHTTRTRPRNISVLQDDAIKALAAKGFGPAAIHRELERLELLDSEGNPGLRTVERVVKALPAPPDPSAEWTLRPGDTDPAFTLETLAWLADRMAAMVAALLEKGITAPAEPLLTVDMVGWLRAVHAARPELPPAEAHTIAGYYLAADRYSDPRLARELSIALGGSEPIAADWAYAQSIYRAADAAGLLPPT